MAQQATLDTMIVKRIQEACAAERAERAMDLSSLLHLEKSYAIAIKVRERVRACVCSSSPAFCIVATMKVELFRDGGMFRLSRAMVCVHAFPRLCVCAWLLGLWWGRMRFRVISISEPVSCTTEMKMAQ